MKRLVPAFGVPLILAVGLTQGDARLTALSSITPSNASPYSLAPLSWTLEQMPSAPATSKLRVTPLPRLVLPSIPPPRAPGDVIPRAYMVYGLRTGPGGMACTDRNGRVMSMPFNPHIIIGPEQSLPRTYALPRRAPLPAPKKLPRK